jgi:hypothetical protein
MFEKVNEFLMLEKIEGDDFLNFLKEKEEKLTKEDLKMILQIFQEDLPLLNYCSFYCFFIFLNLHTQPSLSEICNEILILMSEKVSAREIYSIVPSSYTHL